LRLLLVAICILSLTVLFVLYTLLKKYHETKPRIFNKRLDNIINIITLISVVFGILSLLTSSLGLLYETRKASLTIEFYTPHGLLWNYENANNLCLSLDSDHHVCYSFGIPSEWNIAIKNTGTKYADNLKIKIQFDGFVFTPEPESYTLSDFIYGTGSYASINYVFSQTLKPGEVIDVPALPWENTYMDYDSISSKTNMKIKLYENNSLVLEKNYPINIVANELVSDICILDNVEDAQQTVYKLNQYYVQKYDNHGKYFNKYILKELDTYPLNANEFSIEDYQKAYKFYLERINVYNPSTSNCYKQLALFYGRLYYQNVKNKIPDLNLEQAITNDFISFKN